MRKKWSLSMIIYSLLRATKEGVTGRNVHVMMSVGVREVLLGLHFTPDLTARLLRL